ncbi:MAG: ADP-ribosylglycohydrolase family protein [Clostridiales Family XIII bacterium]|jgi:ADP-ribosylglycohydrolase|nr:ADP-ribosylglycohydrolase family protein [Clostridiales Family XIII bacterium]
MKVGTSYFRGCLLGGAAADARGFGEKEGGRVLVSDNTQMTCFTVDGLIWADERAIRRGVYAYIPCLFYSYQKWYYTQTGSLADKNYEFILNGEILDWEDLFARRGSGRTSIDALAGSIGNKYGTIKNSINNSNACGSVTRTAPIGLYFWKNPETAFRIGMESSALTHGHRDALLAAGFFAAFTAFAIQGREPEECAEATLELLKKHEDHKALSSKIEQAIMLAGSPDSAVKAMSRIGGGYTADEAIALALFLILRYKDDFDGAVNTATGFGGNTDSVPPIVGNAIGALYGQDVIPRKWLYELELVDLIKHGADLMLERVDAGLLEE